jgi:hypothetical protein
MSVDPSKIPVVKSPHSIVIAAHSVIPHQYLILDIVPNFVGITRIFQNKKLNLLIHLYLLSHTCLSMAKGKMRQC